jgi:hypothetical protein
LYSVVDGVGSKRNLAEKDYNGFIMVTNIESSSLCEICAHIKNLGYAASGRVRLYGEEFEVVSDPFPQEDGIAVHAKPLRSGVNSGPVRVLQLPATVVLSVKGKIGKVA